MTERITVTQVARAMGIDLDNRVSWAVGTVMANLHVERFGEQPPKELRPKTNGPGSHCFATYPPTWEAEIRSVITSHLDAARNQGDLFEA